MTLTPRHFLFFILAIVCIDGAARVAASRMPAPRVFANYTIQRQADLIVGNGQSTLVFMGTSLMGAGADPAIVAAGLGEDSTVFNASVGGGGPLLLEHWANDLVIPELAPEVVVIGIGPRDANDAFDGAVQTEVDYLGSKGRQRLIGDLGFFPTADEWLEQNLGVFQLRTAYREPASAAAYALNGSGNWRRATTDNGRIVFFDGATYTAPVSGTTTIEAADPLTGFTVGGRNLEAVAAAIRTLQSSGIDVVLIDLPRVQQALVDVIGVNEVANYEAELARLAEAEGVRLIQGDEWIDDLAHFADRHHLNRAGTNIFSQRLAEELSSQ